MPVGRQALKPISGAPYSGALFSARGCGKLLLFVLLLATALVSRADCAAPGDLSRAEVRQVYDGDTFELTDGRRVRFIGINSAEMGRDGRPPQPWAEAARDSVIEQLKTHRMQVRLLVGEDTHDRYRRLLAHPFLPDGSNLSEQLLRRGLAVRIAVPPNLWGQDCYRRAEQHARQQHLGLWSSPVEQTHAVPLDRRGFLLLQGRITRIGHSKKSIWLNFGKRFAARIARKDLDHFGPIDADKLLDRRVEVRGWVHGYKNQLVMRLRHSSMLEIVK